MKNIISHIISRKKFASALEYLLEATNLVKTCILNETKFNKELFDPGSFFKEELHWNATYIYDCFHILLSFLLFVLQHFLLKHFNSLWCAFSYLHRIKIYFGGVKLLLVLRVKMLSNEMKALKHSIKLDFYWHFGK